MVQLEDSKGNDLYMKQTYWILEVEADVGKHVL